MLQLGLVRDHDLTEVVRELLRVPADHGVHEHGVLVAERFSCEQRLGDAGAVDCVGRHEPSGVLVLRGRGVLLVGGLTGVQDEQALPAELSAAVELGEDLALGGEGVLVVGLGVRGV